MGLSSEIKGLILDMDGVLWRGNQPVGDLATIFTTIQKRGFNCVLATNNATRTVEQYQNKLKSFGVVLEEWQIITSAIATADYLSRHFSHGSNVFVVGEEPLIDTLSKYGLIHRPEGDAAKAVVVALDRTLTYEKLRRATLLIRSGAVFIATNPDPSFPEPEGLTPGAGSIVALVEKATDKQPTVIGKPAPGMYKLALERLNSTPEETLVVGDRLETDIAGAQQLNCRSAVVLSGVTPLSGVKAWEPAPDFVAHDLQQLLEMLKND
jgi:4-nitrophenyl phosphatase